MIARLGLVLGVVSLQGLAAMSGIGDFRRGSGSGCPGFGCPDYRTPDYRIPDYRTPDNPSPIPASAAARTSGSEPGPASQETAPAVRVSVEVIPIDVQVLDCHGKPVTGLGAEKFSVTINGRRDRVLSANMIQTAPAPHAATAAALDAGPPGAEALRAGRRVIVLAIDCISFSPGTVQIAVDHARQFIARLPADDLVGLFAYPIGADIDPTTDRAKVSRALDTVVGSATWAW